MRALCIILVGAAAIAIGSPRARAADSSDPWAPFAFLVGDWVGEGSGAPGESAGQFSFAYDLDNTVLVRKNQAEIPATRKRVAASHEDLMVIFKDDSGKPTRAAYFDNENHFILYTLSLSEDGKTLTFTSDPKPSVPREKLTYTRTGEKTMDVSFAMSSPEKPDDFQPYLTGKAHKKK